MNDPHVESVTYRVVYHYTTIYRDVPPAMWETDFFVMHLSGEVAEFQLKEHFSTVGDAREAIEAALKDWQMLIGLARSPDEILFVQPSARVTERQPTSGSRDATAAIEAHVSVNASAILAVRRKDYPAFPTQFRRSPEVESMYRHYCEFHQGGGRLTELAYYCLTVLENAAAQFPFASRKAKKRLRVAAKYRIHPDVLETMGGLSAKGSPDEARKAPKDGNWQPLTSSEKAWLHEAVQQLIRRAGEVAADRAGLLAEIGLSSLPPMS